MPIRLIPSFSGIGHLLMSLPFQWWKGNVETYLSKIVEIILVEEIFS